MIAYLRRHPGHRVLLVEKTDRLYRNFKDYLTIEELALEIHLVKENEILSKDSRSSEKFVHAIKLVMAKNYIDNLSEEVKKGLHTKAAQGLWPSFAPVGYVNTMSSAGIRINEQLRLSNRATGSNSNDLGGGGCDFGNWRRGGDSK